MPDKPLAPRDILARVMDDGKKTLTPHLAEMLRRDGIEEVDGGEQRRRFWQRAISPEQEAILWQQAMVQRGITQLLPGSPAALEIGLGISKSVYPDRWDMAPQEGRDHQSQQAEWAWTLARRGAPQPKADEMQPVEAPPGLGVTEEGY